MLSQHKPLLVFIEMENHDWEKTSSDFEEAGFKILIFDKEISVLKFIEKNNVQGVFLKAEEAPQAKSLIAKIRRLGSSVAIFCIAQNVSSEKVVDLLEEGADDFFPGDIKPDELVARVKAVLRRSDVATDRRLTANTQLTTEAFIFNNAEINPGGLEVVFKDGVRATLGKKEIGIIYHFHTHRGVAISRNSLIHAVWGVHADTQSRSVDQYITKIRVLFEHHQSKLDCLRTIHGIGYWYDPKLTDEKKPKSLKKTAGA